MSNPEDPTARHESPLVAYFRDEVEQILGLESPAQVVRDVEVLEHEWRVCREELMARVGADAAAAFEAQSVDWLQQQAEDASPLRLTELAGRRRPETSLGGAG